MHVFEVKYSLLAALIGIFLYKIAKFETTSVARPLVEPNTDKEAISDFFRKIDVIDCNLPLYLYH